MKIRTFTTDFDIVSLDFGKRGAYIVYSTLTPQGSQGRTYRIEVDHITTDSPNQIRAEAYRVRSIGRSFPGYDFTHYSSAPLHLQCCGTSWHITKILFHCIYHTKALPSVVGEIAYAK